MKHLLSILLLAAATTRAATITLLPPTPYLQFTDSPFHAAAAAGDALKFGDRFCNDPAATLPNGLGVHDNFNDNDCLSPWVRMSKGEYRLGGSAVDEDNGVQGDPGGWYIFGTSTFGVPGIFIEFNFVPTSDGRFPHWGGFVITGVDHQAGAMAEILGVNNTTLASINLSTSIPVYSGGAVTQYHRFLGFVSDMPVHGIRITGTATLDDLTYGYGTPIPEPCAALLAAVMAGTALLRRRRFPR